MRKDICYVYQHMDGKKVVYVGKGTGGRAWSTTRRREAHLAWLLRKLPDGSFVKVVASKLTSEAALELESQLIDKLLPKFNETKEQRRAWICALAERFRVKRAVVTPHGRFSSIAEAADAVGLNRATANYRVRHNSKGWSYDEEKET